MAHQQTRHRSQPECRRRSQIPLPAGEEGEYRRMDGLSPSSVAPRQLERREPRPPQRFIRMRQRLLTLPVIMALIVSLVWRRGPSIAEVQQVLAREGLLGMAPRQVRPQAITQRRDVPPVAVMGQLVAEVCTRRQTQGPAVVPHPSEVPGREHCQGRAMVDDSMLEALRHKIPVLRERAGLVLGGKMMVMVEAFSHRPLWQLYTESAAANDQRLATEIMAALPELGIRSACAKCNDGGVNRGGAF